MVGLLLQNFLHISEIVDLHDFDFRLYLVRGKICYCGYIAFSNGSINFITTITNMPESIKLDHIVGLHRMMLKLI